MRNYNDEEHSFWAFQQTPQRLSLRDAGEARTKVCSRREGAAGETGPKRFVPVQLRT